MEISFKKECIAFRQNKEKLCAHFNTKTHRCNFFLYDVKCKDFMNKKKQDKTSINIGNLTLKLTLDPEEKKKQDKTFINLAI